MHRIQRYAPRRLRATMLALALLSLGRGAQHAAAHQPHFNETGTPDPAHPYVLHHLDISQVIYGTLGRPGRIDYYQMTVAAGFAADVQIVVPAVPRCAGFRPVLAVEGPGISVNAATPPPTDGTPIAAPPPGSQWLVLQATRWGTSFEPFSRTTYATGPHFQRHLAGGTYLLAVYSPQGHAGTYGLALAGAERPGGDPAFFKKIGPIVRCQVAS